MACARAPCFAFREPPNSAGLRKRSWRPLTVNVAAWGLFCMCAAFVMLLPVCMQHAIPRARAHVEHARGRSPLQAQPGSRLPGRPEAKLVRLYACSLRCMPLNTILNVHAAWHAKTLLYRFERLANPTDSRNALSQRPTLSDLTAT